MDNTDDTQNFGIDPAAVYRRHDPTAKKIVGLKDTQIDEGVKDGTLPPLIKLNGEGGKASGWIGQQLIDLQRQRLKQAAEQQKKRLEQAKANKPKATGSHS